MHRKRGFESRAIRLESQSRVRLKMVFYFAFLARCAAQRLRCASAMRLRASALRTRFLRGFVAGAAAGTQWYRLLVAVISAVVPWALFFVINFVSPRAMGFGDVRLALLIGFGLGWLGAGYAFLGFLVASVLGSVVGVTMIALGKAGRRTPIPFGTFLAAGAVVAALAGAPVVNWYAAQIH